MIGPTYATNWRRTGRARLRHRDICVHVSRLRHVIKHFVILEVEWEFLSQGGLISNSGRRGTEWKEATPNDLICLPTATVKKLLEPAARTSGEEAA